MAQLQRRAAASAPASSAAPALAAIPVGTPASVSGAAPAAPSLPARRSPLRSEAAYDGLLAEILAVPSALLLPVNVDVMAAITTVSDALPGLLALCTEPDAPASATRAIGMTELRVEELEQLEQYTLALGHAHLLYCGSFSPALDVTLLAAELSKVRDGMLAHAEALAVQGFLDGQRLKRIALHSAHRALAGDVIALCAAFKDHWPQLEDKTPYTLDEQYRLVRLALDLLAALGAREPAPDSAAESSLIRQRAFTLFASAYERARAAVQRLRTADGDCDAIAPPLCAGRAARRRGPGHDGESEPAPITRVSGTRSHAAGA